MWLASDWPHRLPDTYHRIQSSGMFQASAWRKSQEPNPKGWGRGMLKEKKAGPGEQAVLSASGCPAGRPRPACPAWLSPGPRKLPRH